MQQLRLLAVRCSSSSGSLFIYVYFFCLLELAKTYSFEIFGLCVSWCELQMCMAFSVGYFKYNPIPKPIPIAIKTQTKILNVFNSLDCKSKRSLILVSIELKFEFRVVSNALCI